MSKNKSKNRINKGDRVQFPTGEPHPTVPGFPKTVRGTVTAIEDDGKLTVQVRKKVYRGVNPKKCNKL